MAKKRKTKYNYEHIIQANCGHGWEDIDSIDTNSNYTSNWKEAKYLKKESQMAYGRSGCRVRIISRKTKK